MRMIDADAARKQIDEKRPGRAYEDAWALTVLDNAPTVDAVPVVRCKDCKYWNPYKSHHYKGHFCDVVTLFVQENEYCAWGKRREDGADDGEIC